MNGCGGQEDEAPLSMKSSGLIVLNRFLAALSIYGRMSYYPNTLVKVLPIWKKNCPAGLVELRAQPPGDGLSGQTMTVLIPMPGPEIVS